MSLPVTVVCAVNHHLISFLSHAVCIFHSHFYLISQESSSSFFAILLYLPSGPTSSLIQRPRSPRWIVLGFTPPSSIPLSLPITLSHSSFPHSFSQRSVHCSLSQLPVHLSVGLTHLFTTGMAKIYEAINLTTKKLQNNIKITELLLEQLMQ